MLFVFNLLIEQFVLRDAI